MNPFTTAEPWLDADKAAAIQEPSTDSDVPTAPDDFLAIFGEPPLWDKLSSYQSFRVERAQWEHDLEYFQGSGIPEGFSEEKIQLAGDLFEVWGMGWPMFYEGRYG